MSIKKIKRFLFSIGSISPITFIISIIYFFRQEIIEGITFLLISTLLMAMQYWIINSIQNKNYIDLYIEKIDPFPDYRIVLGLLYGVVFVSIYIICQVSFQYKELLIIIPAVIIIIFSYNINDSGICRLFGYRVFIVKDNNGKRYTLISKRNMRNTNLKVKTDFSLLIQD